jgi:subtilase family serine protease
MRIKARSVSVLIAPVMVVGVLTGLNAPLAATAGANSPQDVVITFLGELPHRSAALASAAQMVSTPGTPTYRQYLTVNQAAEEFGASDAQIDRVDAAARALGLRAVVDPTRLVVRLSGTVRAWEKAMGQPITFQPSQPGSPYNEYAFLGAQGAPFPTAQDPDFWRKAYLAAIDGLQAAPKPLNKAISRFVPAYMEYVPADDVPAPATATSGSPQRNSIPSDSSPSSGPPTGRSLYFPGSTTQVQPTNPAAALMKSCLNDPAAPIAQGFSVNHFVGHNQVFDAYGLSALQRVSGTAASDRVTIISMGGGFSDQDLAAAAACFDYKKPAVKMTLGTGVRTPFVNIDDETTLDVQTVSSTLKNARSIQMVQVAPSVAGADFVDAYTRALTTPIQPHAITLSYGECEPLVADRGMNPTLESVFQFAAVIGTTVAISSGDGGSSVCQEMFGEELDALYQLLEELISGAQDEPANSEDAEISEALIADLEIAIDQLTPLVAYPRPTVSYPGSSPFVVSVGGTQIQMNPNGTRAGESVWNSQLYAGGIVGNLVGTGGPSASFDAPWYQNPLTRNNVRSVPDISAMAGPSPGLPVVYKGTIRPNGGTSQSSPMMAAALAMISAREGQAKRPPIGFANPWLYQVVKRSPKSVYDVTVGDNQFAIEYAPDSLNIPGCCQADLGYDQASGLGVLQFNELIKHVNR